MTSDEELRLLTELYHRTIADFATEFAISTTKTLTTHLPPPTEVVVIDLINKAFPNDYSSMLIPALQNREYVPILHHIESTENGMWTPRNFPPQSVIKNKPVIYVGVHFTPYVGFYLPYALEKGASRAIYASPTPPPSSLWEYKEGRLIRL